MNDLDFFGAHWSPTQIEGVVYVLGFSSWKRPAVRACFPNAQIQFIHRIPALPAEGAWLVVWGSFEIPANSPLNNPRRILRVEDGFLRSVGLGADLVRPVSWVVDPIGLYYDARTPSRLEFLLETMSFTEELRQRAARVHQAIVDGGLTKYNLGAKDWQKPLGNRRIVLVVGQVETDASLKFGAPKIYQNIELLKAVRAQLGADEYLLYKPHPDVVAKLRAEGAGEDQASALADEVLLSGDMATLLSQVDEVHVMTSLAGFEALLRGVKVVTYGQPFYAGWGLTQDHLPLARRTRRLCLDELIAGVLIAYPVYFNANQKQLVPIEEAITQLQRDKSNAPSHTTWWRVLFRIILRRVVGVR